jgi:hypothetical protein
MDVAPTKHGRIAGASVNVAFVSQKWPGIQVEHLILEVTDFVVWVDKDLDINWQTSQKYDEAGPKDPAEWNAVLNGCPLATAAKADKIGMSQPTRRTPVPQRTTGVDRSNSATRRRTVLYDGGGTLALWLATRISRWSAAKVGRSGRR